MSITQLPAKHAGPARVLALSGGVGGAKLALGLSHCLAPEQLTIVANTADDFQHLGFSISPDLDTVMYTLADVNDKQRGWGLANETFHMIEALQKLGGDTWFQLGDRDLATHIERTRRLAGGESLTTVTAALCKQLGVDHQLLPMSDDPVRTRVNTPQGEMPFQEYFVREQCRPVVTGYRFEGIEQASAQPAFRALLEDPGLAAIIVCPSNPFVSVDPVLQLKGIREAMRASTAPVIAVSPIVGGEALKGPAAKMMAELGMAVTPLAVAEYYGDLLDGFVLDVVDERYAAGVRDLGVAVCCEQTVMKTLADRVTLAQRVLSFAESLEK